MSFILTRGGDRFDVGDPESYIPDIITVAQTLARIPRFNGHHDHNYSVAHHSVAGAMALQDAGLDDAALLFLVHDAHETILGDIPSPLKPHIPGLLEYEARLERHFMAALAGPTLRNEAAREDAKRMDGIIVAAEAQCLGLDDGWTQPRETAYKILSSKPAGWHLPVLSSIRARVELALTFDTAFIGGLMATLYEELVR